MKLIAKLQKMKLPFKMTTDGVIKVDSAVFHMIQTTQEVITGFKIELNLIIDTDINGFKVEPFKSKITHTFSQQQFNDFMEHLNKENATTKRD
jgi:hypothetical protein